MISNNANTSEMIKEMINVIMININLIFFRPYCPDLNPIEDVWRVIKKTIYKSTYNSTKELINLFDEKFYEIIGSKSFYENWLEQNGINF